MADGISSPAAEAPSKDYASWTWKQKLLDLMRSDPSRNIMPEHPESAALIRAKMQVRIWSPSSPFSSVLPQLNRWIWFAKLIFYAIHGTCLTCDMYVLLQNVYGRFIRTVSPKLRPAIQKDSVKKFYQVCRGWSGAMGIREFLYPDILASMTSYNALRCAKVALEGAEPLGGRRADPNGRHRYGVTPLHVAAETFSVDMVKLLFQHGASANLRTGGELVIDGLLPLHVAVENTSMHKFLEDNWDDGDPVDDLIFLLSLPEMVSSFLLCTIFSIFKLRTAASSRSTHRCVLFTVSIYACYMILVSRTKFVHTLQKKAICLKYSGPYFLFICCHFKDPSIHLLSCLHFFHAGATHRRCSWTQLD